MVLGYEHLHEPAQEPLLVAFLASFAPLPDEGDAVQALEASASADWTSQQASRNNTAPRRICQQVMMYAT